MNAVAADGTRFDDLKERFTFFGTSEPDPVAIGAGKLAITPVHYDAKNYHAALRETIERWAALSAINGRKDLVDAEIRRIVKANRAVATEKDRDLFDHLIRRSNASERVRLSALASNAKADLGWLDAIVKIGAERDRERRIVIPVWAYLDEKDRAVFRATVAFLISATAERRR